MQLRALRKRKQKKFNRYQAIVTQLSVDITRTLNKFANQFQQAWERKTQMTEQWCAGTVECLTCGQKWVAVWPLAAEDLECPECKSTDTVREQ